MAVLNTFAVPAEPEILLLILLSFDFDPLIDRLPEVWIRWWSNWCTTLGSWSSVGPSQIMITWDVIHVVKTILLESGVNSKVDAPVPDFEPKVAKLLWRIEVKFRMRLGSMSPEACVNEKV